MVFYEQPNEDWTIRDFQLLEAYQMLENEICPQCQNPIWLCRSNSDAVGWSVRTDICRASKEREEVEWRRDNKGKKPDLKERKSWGRYTYSVPIVPGHLPDGTTLPTRAEFYESMKKT